MQERAVTAPDKETEAEDQAEIRCPTCGLEVVGRGAEINAESTQVLGAIGVGAEMGSKPPVLPNLREPGRSDRRLVKDRADLVRLADELIQEGEKLHAERLKPVKSVKKPLYRVKPKVHTLGHTAKG